MPDPAPWRGEWPSAPALARRVGEVAGAVPDADGAARLMAFLHLLERWAAKFNLVSAATREEIVERHLLDSVAVLPLIPVEDSIADFGSGAGFPGIPIAILRPAAAVLLIESRAHRANFLRQAVRSIPVPNARIFGGRGEELPERGPIRTVVARGVRAEEVAAFGNIALGPGGRLLMMGKAGQDDRIPGYRSVRAHAYRLSSGQRHVVTEFVPTSDERFT